MPTYEYQCPDGHEFELFQKMSDKPRAKCPVCGKTAIRQISGGAGLVFKGSGFYITDYGKDGKGPRKEGTDKGDKSERAERSEKAEKQEKAESTSKSEAKASSGDAGKHGPRKSEGKAEAAPAKPAPDQGKGKASSE